MQSKIHSYRSVKSKLQVFSGYVNVRSYTTLDTRITARIGIYLPIDGVLSLVYSAIFKDLRHDDRI